MANSFREKFKVTEHQIKITVMYKNSEYGMHLSEFVINIIVLPFH